MARAAAAALAILAAVALPAWGTAPAPAEPGVHVHISGGAYVPQVASLLAGEYVAWHNHDSTAHRSVADDLSFETPTLGQGETALTLMPLARTVPYFCEFHNAMTGTLLVSAPGERPDLVVGGMTGVDVVPGALVHVNVTVRNLGLAEAPPTNASVRYRYHGNDYPIGQAEVPLLGPGSAATVTVPWLVAGKVGEFLVEGLADAGDHLAEADEGNNLGASFVTVLVPGFPGLDLLRPL